MESMACLPAPARKSDKPPPSQTEMPSDGQGHTPSMDQDHFPNERTAAGGIEHLDERNVKSWMLSNLDRMHIFVPDGHPVVAASLEVYVRVRIGSVFEGAASGLNPEPTD